MGNSKRTENKKEKKISKIKEQLARLRAKLQDDAIGSKSKPQPKPQPKLKPKPQPKLKPKPQPKPQPKLKP